MTTGVMTEQAKRQRKMLLLMPLILAPVLALIFHGLGGGGHHVSYSGHMQTGLNMKLPDAQFDSKKKGLNKMGIYTEAEKDSVRLAESRKSDPYFGSGAGSASDGPSSSIKSMKTDTNWRRSPAARGSDALQGLESAAPESQANELLEKLNALKGVISRQASGQQIPQMPEGLGRSLPGQPTSIPRLPGPGDLSALAGLVGQPKGDPDLDKISGMLDKILKIQHPEMADTSAPRSESEPAVGQLTRVPKVETVGTLTDGGQLAKSQLPDQGGDEEEGGMYSGSGFMEIDGQTSSDTTADNLLAATVVQSQTLVSGESVAIRLGEKAVIGGMTVPSGTMMAAKSSLSGERLLLHVSSIRVGNRSVAVSLEVIDQDGVPGIREAGSINRDAAKQSAGEAISGVQTASALSENLAGQGMAAGLEGVKALVGQKIRLVRVSVPAGYKVFLRNSKSTNN